MPDFCACCGAIQTPTWRKAFYKEIEGTPAGVVTSLDEPGAIVGFEVVIPQADDKNPVEKYKVFKKSLTNTDKANGDFTAMQLCNPCGLHFVKYGPKKGGARSSRKKKKDDKQAPLTFDAVPEPASHAFSDYPDEVMGYMQQEWTQPKDGQEKDKPGQNPFPPHSEPTTDAQDKENVPPAEVDDGFAHLFEDLDGNQLLGNPKTPKSTRSIRSFMELMKTPTSKSKRSALTPRDVLLSEGNLALDAAMDAFILQSTPSKAVKTPKTAMTPFTQSLNDLLGTAKTPRSAARNNPSWNLSSPGNSGLIDFSNYDFSMPSTDFPFPSSPPGHFGATFNFALYEDPLTSTDNFWGETSAFNGSSDSFQGAQADGEQTKGNNAAEKRAVELGRIIDEVTAGANKDGGKNNGAEDTDTTTTTTTTEDDAENAGATPAGSEAVDLIPVGP
ncbi:Gata transcription factor [Neofusicoccum parvum]|uniref:Gata transcription factor n=1 Tax=Neofusicoccum parvum TaxID=310453 RepID=A0ACB5SA75_9PEZI|nr:Gata transcription factor [Neofusicoccum parvum]